MKNVGKHRHIEIVKIERRRNYLVSELNYQTIKFFGENFFAIEIKKL